DVCSSDLVLRRVREVRRRLLRRVGVRLHRLLPDAADVGRARRPHAPVHRQRTGARDGHPQGRREVAVVVRARLVVHRSRPRTASAASTNAAPTRGTVPMPVVATTSAPRAAPPPIPMLNTELEIAVADSVAPGATRSDRNDSAGGTALNARPKRARPTRATAGTCPSVPSSVSAPVS